MPRVHGTSLRRGLERLRSAAPAGTKRQRQVAVQISLAISVNLLSEFVMWYCERSERRQARLLVRVGHGSHLIRVAGPRPKVAPRTGSPRTSDPKLAMRALSAKPGMAVGGAAVLPDNDMWPPVTIRQ